MNILVLSTGLRSLSSDSAVWTLDSGVKTDSSSLKLLNKELCDAASMVVALVVASLKAAALRSKY